jgi:hypothetical protein
MFRYTHPSAGLVTLHQREAQRLLWKLFFGRTFPPRTRGVEAGGVETFLDTGRLIRTALVLAERTWLLVYELATAAQVHLPIADRTDAVVVYVISRND